MSEQEQQAKKSVSVPLLVVVTVLLTVLVTVILFVGWNDDMTTALFGFVMKAIKVTAAVITSWWVLRLLDNLSGYNFKEEIYPKIVSNPMALSLYVSVRLFSVSLMMALMW